MRDSRGTSGIRQRTVMKTGVIKRVIWILVVIVLFYTAWVIGTNYRENIATLRAFPWTHLPLILGAVLVNFLLREMKWEYFRRAAGIRAPRFGSFLVWFSGLSMTISPGRVGELIKPFMYKEYFGQKMRRSIPLVFCERVSDLLGMVLLAALTIGYYVSGVQDARQKDEGSAALIYGFLVLTLVFMAFMLWLARSKRKVYSLIRWMTRHPRLRRTGTRLQQLYFSTYPLLTVKNLVITTLMAAVSWSFECVALLMILHGAGAEGINLGEASFVFCMATLFGGFLFFAPGGLGGFEGSAKVMLTLLGLSNAQIVPAILITRFCTLFFSVVLGFGFILLTSLKYHKSLRWDKFEQVEEVAAEVETSL